MVISLRSHHEVVALLQQQITKLEERNQEVIAERNFYRTQLLKKEALPAFPAVPTPTEPPAPPPPVLTEAEQRKAFQLDRSDWTIDDRELFVEYWINPARKRGVPDDEMDWHYHQQYGGAAPLLAFTADS